MNWRESLSPEHDPPPLDEAAPIPSPPPRSEGKTGSPGARREAGKGATADRFAVINAFADLAVARLDRAEIAVWLLLWRDTKPDGLARTSQADLARRAGATDRTVRRALDALRGAGLLVIVRVGGPRRGASVYRVVPPGRKTMADARVR